MKSSRTRIQSVSRAVALITALAELPQDDRSPRALAARTGVSLPSVYHFMNTLEDAGVVVRDMARNYQFGPTFAFLAETFFRENAVPDFLLEAVKTLAESTGESAYFSAWRQGAIQMITSMEGTHAVHVAKLHQGYSGGAHSRASGKLLLALSEESVLHDYLAKNPLEPVAPKTITDQQVLLDELQEIRERGYATDDEEFLEGVGCFSAPVYRHSRLMGALTLSAPLDRFRSRHAELAAAVVGAAAGIAAGDPSRDDGQETEQS
jgi:DNA-binding IclR family transcriptional regulator